MKKVIRVSESNLVKLIQKVLVEEKHINSKRLNEQLDDTPPAFNPNEIVPGMVSPNDKAAKEKQQRLQNIANMKRMASANKGMVTVAGTQMRWTDYLAKYGITPEEVNASEQLNVTTDANLANQQERYKNIVSVQNSVDNNGVIQSGNMKGKPWSEFLQQYKITPDEITKANEYVKTIPNAVAKPKVNTKPAVVRDYVAMLAEI